MTCKQRFPFRFGTTSYIIPADIIPNVEFLKDKVDDIELVLFESDEFSNLPSFADMQKLAALACDSALTYSVHLPLDVYAGHLDSGERTRSVQKCLKIIELTRSLPKSAFVMHFEAGPGIDINGFTADRKCRFIDALQNSMSMLLTATDEAASEEQQLRPEEKELDIGHLEYYGYPTAQYLERYLSRAKVLHMHGSLDGKDHNSLSCMKRETLDLVMNALSEHNMPERVMTMEIFSHDDFLTSCATMQPFLM